MNKLNKKVSRLLSNVLRHKPENIGIELDKGGWVKVGRLLDQLEVHNHEIDYEDLMEIVETNDKKRFEIKKADFGDNGYDDFIRASQGHSVPVDLGLPDSRPPLQLYHGTVQESIDSILKNGMGKMRRHDVHLSVDIETATNVGARRGKPIILEIQSARMFIDGYKFQISKNGVWLTKEVPGKYIRIKK